MSVRYDMELWDMEEDLSFRYSQNVLPDGTLIWIDVLDQEVRDPENIRKALRKRFPQGDFTHWPIEEYLMALGKLMVLLDDPYLSRSVTKVGGVLRGESQIVKFQWSKDQREWFLRIGESVHSYDRHFFVGSVWVTVPRHRDTVFRAKIFLNDLIRRFRSIPLEDGNSLYRLWEFRKPLDEFAPLPEPDTGYHFSR